MKLLNFKIISLIEKIISVKYENWYSRLQHARSVIMH